VANHSLFTLSGDRSTAADRTRGFIIRVS
jgi:hypothetical protein